MTNEEIFENGPSEATHYHLIEDRYLRQVGDSLLYVWTIKKTWVLTACNLCMYKPSHIIKRDMPWDGHGLPSVGTVCEIRIVSGNSDWSKAKIVFASQNVVVWAWVGDAAENGLCTSYRPSLEIRTIRSAEQIKADERDADIVRLCIDAGGTESCASQRRIAERLIDKGWRKPDAEAGDHDKAQ